MDDFPAVRQPVAVGIQFAPLAVQFAGHGRSAAGIEHKAAAQILGRQGIGPVGIEVFVEQAVFDVSCSGIVVVQQAGKGPMAAVHGHIAAVIEVVVGQQRAVQVVLVQHGVLAALLQHAPVLRDFFAGPRHAPDPQFVNPQPFGKSGTCGEGNGGSRPPVLQQVGADAILAHLARLHQCPVHKQRQGVPLSHSPVLEGAGQMHPAVARQRPRCRRLVPHAAQRVEADVRHCVQHLPVDHHVGQA